MRECLLECYVKVALDNVKSVFSRSGKEGIFLSELAKDGPRPQVEWVEAGEVVGPAYLKLATIKAEGAPLAFRRGGGTAFGFRLPASTPLTRPYAWRARNIPNFWTEADVRSALEGAGFSDFELLSPGHGKVPWFFRAKLQNDGGQPSLAVQTGRLTIDIERAAPRRKLENAQSKVITNRPVPKPPKALPVSTEAEDVEMEPPTSQGAAATPPSTEVRGRPDEQTGKKGRVRSRSLKRKGVVWWEEHEGGGDGNCFYNCAGAAFGLQRDKMSWEDVSKSTRSRGCTLRSELAAYIREKSEYFKSFWLPPDVPQTDTEEAALRSMEAGDPAETWGAYLANLDRPKRWCDELAFRAATKRLNCRILVILGDPGNPTQVLQGP